MGVAADLIASLREEADAVDDGEFSLDPAEARRKLEAFRYADRDTYLCHLVEGLCALGAQRVEVTTERADLWVEADAVPLPRAIGGLHGLFAAVFSAHESRRAFALARLGIGVDMALGHDDIEAIGVELGDGSVTVVGIYERGNPSPFVGRVQTRPARARIIIDRSARADRDEIRVARARNDLWRLKAAAELSPRAIYIHGDRVSRGPPALLVERELQGPSFHGRVGFHAPLERPTLFLFSAGLRVGAVPQPQWRPHTAAYVELDAPVRDLAQAAVARDATYEAVVQAAQATEDERLHELWMRWRTWRRSGYPRGVSWSQVRAALNTDGRLDEHEG